MNFFLQEFLHCSFIRVLSIYFSDINIKTDLIKILSKTCLQVLLSYSIVSSSPILILVSTALSYYMMNSEESSLALVMQFVYILVFYEKRLLFSGYESILRLLNFFLIILTFYFDNPQVNIFSVFFSLINFEVLFHSWLLIQELTTFSNDIKAKKKTFAIALGRYESYKMFTLFQILFYSLVLVDCSNNKPLKALIFLLIPWTCYFVFLIRNMKMSPFSLNYFFFSLISSFILIVFS